jgi:hypothetical protein
MALYKVLRALIIATKALGIHTISRRISWSTGHLGTPINLNFFKTVRKLLKIGKIPNKGLEITNMNLLS